MKNKIRIDVNALQDMINIAAAEPSTTQSPEKILVNIEDENGKVVRTVAIKIHYDSDDGIYTVEWIP